MEDRKPNVRRLSTLAAFTLSLGTAIGWGSFVITNSAYLQEAGPIGSMIGLLIGMLIMIVIAYNYHVMINKYPGKRWYLYLHQKRFWRRARLDQRGLRPHLRNIQTLPRIPRRRR